MKTAVKLVLLFLLSTTSLYSQDFWTHIGQFTNWVVFASNSSNQVFAGTTSGIYKSTNYGDNWIYTDFPYNSSVAINSLGHIFAGTQNGIYRSTNGGINWQLIGPANIHFPVIAFNSSNHIFAGDTSGIYRSTDNGQSWTQINNGLVSHRIGSIAFNPAGHVFVGTAIRIHRSTNNGNSWQELNPSPYGAYLAIGQNGYILAGSNYLGDNPLAGHVFLSTNNGDSWTQLSVPGSGYSYTVAISPGGDYYAGAILSQSPIQVFRSTNNGSNWTNINSGLLEIINYSVQSFGFTSNGYIFCSQANGHIYRSYQGITIVPGTQNEIPQSFRLYQNFPNPFNPATKIKFDIPSVETHRNASLRIFDALGREAAILVNEELKPGTYEIEWDASDYPGGVYFYKLQEGNYSESRKMMLVK